MSAPGVARSGPTALLVAALASLLTACGAGPSGPAGPAPGDPDLDGSWHLVSGRDALGSLPDPASRTITLVVDGRDAAGVSACNHYSTTFSLDGDDLRIGPAAGTEMACEPPVMELEQRYLEALVGVRHAQRAETTLSLTGPDVVLDFELDPPVVDRDLVGTTWLLDSLVDGDTASSTYPGGELRLLADGTLEGSSGCAPFRGRYRVEGDDVTVTALDVGRSEDAACPFAQHRHVVDVLTEGFTVEVDGDRLTLLSARGRGLSLRAA